MGPKVRQQLILNRIKVQEVVTTTELAHEFGVSHMTVRRDLHMLETKGYVELTHGGAIWKKNNIIELPMMTKIDEYVEEKRAIAAYCADLISEGDTVFIETGTTTQAVANLLTSKKSLTVHTNSLMVANTMSKFENIELYMAPGRYRDLSSGFLGPLTNSYISNFSYDYAVIGTEGIDLDFGVSTPDIEDALAKKSVIDNSKNVILVADNSKFNKTFLCKICSLKDVTLVVTDEHVTQKDQQAFADRGIHLVCAKCEIQ